MEEKYKEAADQAEKGNYDDAIAIYESIIDYSDSEEKITKVKIAKAESLMDDDKFEEAQEIITGIEDWENQEELAHDYDVCNVHLNGVKGLIEYMQENIPLDEDGDNLETVTVSRESDYKVLVYYSADDACLYIDVDHLEAEDQEAEGQQEEEYGYQLRRISEIPG